MTIVFAILLFSFLIFIHEFGHFAVAKLSGVQVNEFSIFMGPAIWKKQHGETLYSIRCIPIGGYCAMEGEDEDTDNPRSFLKAAWWKRFFILIAGAAMNFLAGFLIMVIVSTSLFQAVPTIDFLRTGSSLACEGGLRAGDELLEVDGTPIHSTADFSAVLSRDQSVTEFDVLVKRDGEEVLLQNVPIIPREFEADDEGEAGTFYGIQWKVKRLHFGQVIENAWNSCVYFVKLVWMSLEMLVSGEAGLSDMSGPVGIVDMMNETAQASETTRDAILNLLYIGAFIAVNLAVMNLLPIPALDGGRILFLLLTVLIETITRKKLDPKYEGYINAVGMIALLALMAFVMFKDIWGLFR